MPATAAKVPRPRIRTREMRARSFICRVQMSGTGRSARVKSVMMFVTAGVSGGAVWVRGERLTAVEEADFAECLTAEARCVACSHRGRPERVVPCSSYWKALENLIAMLDVCSSSGASSPYQELSEITHQRSPTDECEGNQEHNHAPEEPGVRSCSRKSQQEESDRNLDERDASNEANVRDLSTQEECLECTAV
jgi:hypothetical protein